MEISEHHKGQISIEYMSLVGITAVIVISLLVISNYYSRQVEDTINTNQLDQIAKEIVDTAESMYYFGEPSRTTIKVFIPKGIRDVNVGSNEISFRVNTHFGEIDMSYSSDVALQGDISTSYGFHYITIEAKEGYVWINST